MVLTNCEAGDDRYYDILDSVNDKYGRMRDCQVIYLISIVIILIPLGFSSIHPEKDRAACRLKDHSRIPVPLELIFPKTQVHNRKYGYNLSMLSQVLVTSLCIPLSRPEYSARIKADLDQIILLISAPAGSGNSFQASAGVLHSKNDLSIPITQAKRLRSAAYPRA